MSNDADRANIRITPFALPNPNVRIARGESDPVLGWYSPDYNVKSPCSVAVYSARLQQSALFGWVITTNAAQTPGTVSAQLVGAAPGVARVRLVDAQGRNWAATFQFSHRQDTAPQFTLTRPDGRAQTIL